MAFKSDFENRRTWDPDTGWELFQLSSGRVDPKYKLAHPDHGFIEFLTKIKSREEISAKCTSGRAIYKTKFSVFLLSKPIEELTQYEMDVIQDALYAFDGFHSGPSGPVEVEFLI